MIYFKTSIKRLDYILKGMEKDMIERFLKEFLYMLRIIKFLNYTRLQDMIKSNIALEIINLNTINKLNQNL